MKGQVRPLVYLGHPALRQQAKRIEDPLALDYQTLAADMLITMLAQNGVGLAAPQIARSARLIVYQTERTESPDQTDLHVLFNPEFTPLSDSQSLGLEGCLSIPTLYGMVSRYDHIGYRGLDAQGRLREGEASGFHARVLQHEIDHLNGILYPDWMQPPEQLCHKQAWIKKPVSTTQ
jgi:peptide deformylase